MNNDDKRIREFAYQIWESEGKPEGQEARPAKPSPRPHRPPV